MKSIKSVIYFLSLVIISSLPASAHTPGKRDISITKILVDKDTSELVILGRNFNNGDTPQVKLADNMLKVFEYTPTSILAEFPAGTEGGDYLLTVTTGRGRRRIATWNFTIGNGDSNIATSPDGPCYDNQNRYVDCGNGTVTDTVTGYIWTKNAGCIPPLNYASANQAAEALRDGVCGLTDNSKPGDWRLPTQAEWAATIKEAVRLGCTLQNSNQPSLTDISGTVCFNDGEQPFENVDPANTAVYLSSTAVPDNPKSAYSWNTNGNTSAYGFKIHLVQGWAIRREH